jgi:hypothetical protein
MLRASLAIALLLALPALSTTIPPLSAHDLVERSDLVARVVVRSHESAWVGKKILTFYELDVVGAPWVARTASDGADTGAHALVAFPGGVVGDIGQSVPGTPVLVDGAEYVLCLSKPVGPRGARAPIGLWQGVWAVDASGAVRAFTHAGPSTPNVDVEGLRAQLAGAR